MSALAANSTSVATQNSLTFDVTPNAADIAVFKITAAVLGGASSSNISFRNLSEADPNLTIIINVTGGSSFAEGQGSNFNPDPYTDEHVIWNFGGFTSLNFKSWGGAVLAGDATVTSSSQMDGFLYAANFDGDGELHNYDPNITTLGSESGSRAAPEPSTWAMIVTGFAALGYAGRRRRQPSRAI